MAAASAWAPGRAQALARLAALAVACWALPAPGEPCSICRCGDPTFGALGTQGYAALGWRLALDWERFEKSEGPPAESAEELVENRVTALAAYGFSERFTLLARVPFSARELTQIEGGARVDRVETRGLSDPELSAQLRVWASRLAGPLGRRTSVSLAAGVKTALGANDQQRDAERLDEHAQPGTGSTDAFGGVAVVHLLDKRSTLFGSAQYRHTGENDAGYRYGRVVLANLAYERKLGGRLDAVLEANYRHAGADLEGASAVPNTGGSMLYLTPRLLVDLGHGLVLRGAAQLPVARDLNGTQDERAVLNLGLSLLVGIR